MEDRLIDRPLEVAVALRDACARNGGNPVSPRHCGGTARSDHSARLAGLVKRGFATEAPKNPWGGGKVYALTQAGLRAIPEGR
jgi:hypothetical protein